MQVPASATLDAGARRGPLWLLGHGAYAVAAFALGGTWYLLLAALPKIGELFTPPDLLFGARGLTPLLAFCSTSLAVALALRRPIGRARGASLIGVATASYLLSAALLPLLWFATSFLHEFQRFGAADLSRSHQWLRLALIPGIALALAVPAGVVGLPWALWCVHLLRSIQERTGMAAPPRPAPRPSELEAGAGRGRFLAHAAASAGLGVLPFAARLAIPRSCPLNVAARRWVEQPGALLQDLGFSCAAALLVGLALRPWILRARGASLWGAAAAAWLLLAVFHDQLLTARLALRNRLALGVWWPAGDSSSGWGELWSGPFFALALAAMIAPVGIPLTWMALLWLRRILGSSR